MVQLFRPYSLLAIAILSFTGCTARPLATAYSRTETHAFQNTSDTALARAYMPIVKKHPGESGFHLLPLGTEALMMRIAMVNAAQRSIDLQYFSTQDDTTGKLLLEAIARAADRGVRVRMLLDDWNLDDFQAGAVALNANPHIEIRVFNPYSTREQSVFSRIGNASAYLDQFTRRMHNKAIIADNQVAIVGSRNLGDEYFDAGKEINFRDVDILTVGPVVKQISQNFDRYWNGDESFLISTLNLPSANPDDIQKLQDSMREYWKLMLHSPTGKALESMSLPHQLSRGKIPLIWGTSELAADNPDKINQPAETAVSAPAIKIDKLARKAKHEFIVFTPYFVPLDNGVAWLRSLEKRGINVRIVTNSLSSTDMVPAHAGYSHYREALVQGGIELYEVKSSPPKSHAKKMFKPSSQNGLHAKIYMIDRRDVVIGSFNFDPRSIYLNTEQVLVIHSPELCAQITEIFEDIISPGNSYRVVLEKDLPQEEKNSFSPGSLAWVTEEDGKIVYYNFNPHTGFWRSVVNGFFSILPIDKRL